MIADPLALTALVAILGALALWLESRFGWAAAVGSTLLAIFFGALLSNLGAVPVASAVYDGVFGPVTSLAIAWLLLAVDLRDLRRAGPRMLAAFALALVATAAGAFAAFALFAEPAVGGPLEAQVPRMSAVMVGTYSGGSLNFAAVGRAVGLPEDLFAAAAASDNALTALWMGATLVLPLWLARFYPPIPRTAFLEETHPLDEPDEEPAAGFAHPLDATPLSVPELAQLAALGLGLVWASGQVGLLVPALAGVPDVVWLTTFSLAVGLLPPVRRLRGAFQLGLLALTLFFVVIGIGCRFSEVLRVGIEVFYFTATVVAVHAVVLYGGGRLLRLDLGSLSVASQAAVGGPSTALALSVARGWPGLALPGMMVGLLGYAAGTYLGLAVFFLLR